MIEQWRNQLFESQNHYEFALNPLGFPLSIAKGTRILGITYRTWKRWEELALLVPEYKLQQIQLQKRASDAKSTSPIVPYMVWVVGKVGEIYDSLPNGMTKRWMAEEWVKANRQDFTREAYQQEQARFTSMALTS